MPALGPRDRAGASRSASPTVRAEDYLAGDAYYARPGHTPVFTAGTEVVEFSPADELAKTMAVVLANLQASEA